MYKLALLAVIVISFCELTDGRAVYKMDYESVLQRLGKLCVLDVRTCKKIVCTKPAPGKPETHESNEISAALSNGGIQMDKKSNPNAKGKHPKVLKVLGTDDVCSCLDGLAVCVGHEQIQTKGLIPLSLFRQDPYIENTHNHEGTLDANCLLQTWCHNGVCWEWCVYMDSING